jgi:hypothetical protein
VFIPSPLQMQVIVTQLMLNNFLHLFCTIDLILLPADVDVMRLGEISSTCGTQSMVKDRFMTEGPSKRLQRYSFDPLLQLPVVQW